MAAARFVYRVHRNQVAADPLAFAAAIGWTPDTWQAEYLTSTAKQKIVFCNRQAGKTDCIALSLVHDHGFRHHGRMGVVVSKGLTEAQVMMRRVKKFLRLARSAGIDMPSVTGDSTTRIEWEHGGSVQAFPTGHSDGVRAPSVHHLVIDEAARVPDEMIHGSEPTRAAVGGTLSLLSTPNGKRGHFYSVWTNPESPNRWAMWRTVAPLVFIRSKGIDPVSMFEGPDVPVHECFRIQPEFLEQQWADVPQRKVLEEYYGVFMDADDAAFSQAHIDRAFLGLVRPVELAPDFGGMDGADLLEDALGEPQEATFDGI